MLSNLLANYALDRAREWMNRYRNAGDIDACLRALRKAENWDDARMWIDGVDTWRSLRAKRRASRERHDRQALPFVVIDVEGLRS